MSRRYPVLLAVMLLSVVVAFVVIVVMMMMMTKSMTTDNDDDAVDDDDKSEGISLIAGHGYSPPPPFLIQYSSLLGKQSNSGPHHSKRSLLLPLPVSCRVVLHLVVNTDLQRPLWFCY